MANGMDIRIEGAEELISKLTKLDQMERVKKEIDHGARFIEGKLRHYPAKKYVPNRLIATNDRVRRGFFYHLKKGNISVPYKRSYTLQDKWTVQSRRAGWEAVVGNNAPAYKHLVQGKRQTYQHAQSGWLTVAQATSVYAPRVEGMIRSALEREVKSV